jgi:hypothetical protein
MSMKSWVRLPSGWINEMRLKEFRWGSGDGSSNVAALMVLTVIAQNADETNGVTKFTYDQLQNATGLSRAKISEGIGVLRGLKLIGRSKTKRSTYKLYGYRPATEGGWAKFPANKMYNSSGNIVAFSDFKLRSRAELEALKLFFLFVARRDIGTNRATISYPKIYEYTGVDPLRIKAALSILATHSLIYIEQRPSTTNINGVSNSYRIAGIDPRNHAGTTSRRSL